MFDVIDILCLKIRYQLIRKFRSFVSRIVPGLVMEMRTQIAVIKFPAVSRVYLISHYSQFHTRLPFKIIPPKEFRHEIRGTGQRSMLHAGEADTNNSRRFPNCGVHSLSPDTSNDELIASSSPESCRQRIYYSFSAVIHFFPEILLMAYGIALVAAEKRNVRGGKRRNESDMPPADIPCRIVEWGVSVDTYASADRLDDGYELPSPVPEE